MLKDITLGQFFPGDTVAHRLDPRTKILLVVLYIVALFCAKSLLAYGILAAVLAVCVRISRVGIKSLVRGLKPVVFIIVFTGILNLFFTPGEHILAELGFLRISAEGLQNAVFMVLRIMLLIMGTFLMTYTTSPISLTDGLERLLGGLKKIHVPVHELAMIMSIALRFIPTLIEETDKIMSAQKARGADFESGNIIQKAKALLKMTYGPEGTAPVTEAEYTNYVNNDCYYIEAVQFPLVNYSSYAMADDTQKASIMATAESCMEELSRTATAETASGSALYTAAMTYVPQAMAAMGSEMNASQAVYYAASQLYTPDDLSSYGSDEYNNLTDPLDAAGLNHWTTIDLGTTILVARRIDPFKTYTVDELDSMYDLLTDMKSTAIQDELYAAGAALEHDLNSAALNTYSASKIKKNA